MMLVNKIPPAVIALLINAAGSFAALILEFLFARNMPQESYGEFRYVYSLAMIISTMVLFGGSQKCTKISARFKGGERLNREIGAALIFSLLAFVVSVLIIYLFFSSGYMHLSSIQVVICLLFWVFFRVVFQLFRSLNVGMGSYLSAQLSDRLVLNITPLLIGAFCLLVNVRIDEISASLFSILGTILALSIALYSFLSGNLNFRFVMPSLHFLRNRWGSNLYLMLADASDTIFRLGLVLVVAQFLSFSEVAIYAIVIRLTDSLGMVQSAANAVYSRRIVSWKSECLRGEIKKDPAQSFSEFSAFFILIGFVIVLFFGDYIMAGFGSSYSKYGYALAISIFALLIKQVLGPSHLILVFEGKEKIYFYITFSFSVLLLGACAISSFYFGFNGTLIIYSVLVVLHSFFMAYYCYFVIGRYPGVNFFGFFRYFVSRCAK